MSIIIKGMDMPKGDTFNIVHIYGNGSVALPSWGRGMVKVTGIIAEQLPHEKAVCEWIHKKGMIYCPECAEGFDSIYKNEFMYCPNCGAKMKGVKE